MYDKRNIYDASIKELVKKILLICDVHHIPVVMSFAVANDKTSTIYVSEMLSATAVDTTLTNDQIARHAAVIGGFHVIPASSQIHLEDELHNWNEFPDCEKSFSV